MCTTLTRLQPLVVLGARPLDGLKATAQDQSILIRGFRGLQSHNNAKSQGGPSHQPNAIHKRTNKNTEPEDAE
jgi:hypothetical protein